MLSEVIIPPGGQPLDDLAAQGQPGYDPKLVKGLAMPIGARVMVWIPKILVNTDISNIRYRYTFQWRMRNVFDYRQSDTPYHYPKQGTGAPDTSGVGSLPRVVIPVCNQTIIYNTPAPGTFSDPAVENGFIEDITVGGIYPGVGIGLPINPDGSTGVLQQGILDPGTAIGAGGVAAAAFYEMHEMTAFGDELLVGVWRVDPEPAGPSAAPTWNFGGTDALLRDFLGNGDQGIVPDVGIYVLAGSAP